MAPRLRMSLSAPVWDMPALEKNAAGKWDCSLCGRGGAKGLATPQGLSYHRTFCLAKREGRVRVRWSATYYSVHVDKISLLKVTAALLVAGLWSRHLDHVIKSMAAD